MPISVPKPLTANVPNQLALPSSAAALRAGAAQQPSLQSQIPSPASVLGNAPGGFYKPPNTAHVNQYLSQLKAGWLVNPATGQVVSPGQASGRLGVDISKIGLGGGGRPAMLDPVSAQMAIQQYQQSLGGGGVVPLSPLMRSPVTAAPGQGFAPSQFNIPQTTNYYNPQFSQPGTMGFSSKGYRNY